MSKIIKTIILICVFLFAIPKAEANDIKTLPASACRSTNDKFIVGGFYATAPGIKFNWPTDHNIVNGLAVVDDFATAYDGFLCPIIRDYTTNTNGFAYVNVYVQDHSNSTSVQCSMNVGSQDLFQNYSTQALSTGDAFVTPIGQSTLLTFTAAMLNQSWSHGYATLYCSIAPKDAIVSFAYSEYGGGDAF